MKNYKGVALIEPIIRNSKPLLIITFPSTYNVILALTLLVIRYYLGLETHLTFAGSINDSRVTKLIQKYEASLLVGLENNTQSSIQGNVTLMNHIQGNVQQTIDPTTIGPLSNWPSMAKRLYLIYLIGLALDEYGVDAINVLSDMANDGLIELRTQSLPLSLHGDPSFSLSITPWPMLMNPSKVNANDADELIKLLVSEVLRSNFTGSYADYLLINAPYVSDVNAALVYLTIEAMLWRSATRDDGLSVPLIDLTELSKVVMGKLSGAYDIVKPYIDEVRSRLNTILGSLRGERILNYELKPSHLTLMSRLCQILSFHRFRNSIRLTTSYGSLSVMCIPNSNIDISMSNVVSYNKGLRVTQLTLVSQ